MIETIKSYLDQPIEKGNEIIARYCPFCNGGASHDKKTFSINKETGAYICHRGSCGAKGGYKEIMEHFNITAKPTYFATNRIEKEYKKPPWHDSGLSTKIVNYFKLRGISEEILKTNKITEHNGNIVFNYYWKDQLEFIKYKIPRKPKKGEIKSWRESDTKPILYGMDFCKFDEPLLIIEGEPDKLVLNECGLWNVVSIPSGTQEFEWVNLCWDWLERFKEIIIWGDNDDAGNKWVQQMINKLSQWKLRVVKCKEKDANVLMFKKGKSAVLEHYYSAIPIDKKQLTDLSKIERRDYENEKPIPTGFENIDNLLGGFHLGQLTIWSGYTGGGKSTFISNILINNVKDYKIMAYSGELSKQEFKEIMDFQVLGKKNLVQRYCTVKCKDLAHPNPKLYPLLDKFYEEKMFLFNTDDYATDKELFEVMNYAAKREGIQIFLIDNLMVVPSTDIGTELEKTTKLILKFKNFAKSNNVCVHLVAHPKKPSGDQDRMDIYSVSGTANIVNLADRVIVVHKVREKDIDKNPELYGYQSIVTIEKDRRYGVFGKDIYYNFDFFSKRFYSNEDERDRQYIVTGNKEDKKWIEEKLPF